MRATLSLIRREFAAYFTGPIGYVALLGFLTLTGLLFWIVVGLLTEKGPRGVEYPMQVMLGGADSPEWARDAGVLVGVLFLGIAQRVFWFALNGWLVLGGRVVGLALAVGGGYLHYTEDADQLVILSAKIDRRPVLASYLGVLLAGGMFLALGL